MSVKQVVSDLLNFGELKDNVVKLIEAKFELKRLELQEKAEEAVAELIYYFIFLILGSLCLVFFLMVVVDALNSWLGEPYGLLVVCGTLFLITLLYFVYRVSVKDKITEVIQKRMDELEEEKKASNL